MDYTLEPMNISGVYLKTYPNGTKKIVLKKMRHGQMINHNFGDAELWKGKLDALKEQARQLIYGANYAGRKETVGELIDNFLVITRASDATVYEYKNKIKNHFTPLLKLKAYDLTANMIAAWHDVIGRKAGIVQANHCLTLLSSILTLAVKEGKLPRNLCLLVKHFPESSRDRFLSQEELDKFIAAVKQEDTVWRVYFLLLLYTGARPESVLKMRWQEVDLKAGCFLIKRAKNGEPLMLPLVSEAVALLQELPRTSDWVFPSPGGNALPPSKSGHIENYWKAWRRIIKRAGFKVDGQWTVPHLQPYDLRRSIATYQNLQGVSYNLIAKSLGHKSNKVTGVYARADIETIRGNLERTLKLVVNR